MLTGRIILLIKDWNLKNGEGIGEGKERERESEEKEKQWSRFFFNKSLYLIKHRETWKSIISEWGLQKISKYFMEVLDTVKICSSLTFFSPLPT